MKTKESKKLILILVCISILSIIVFASSFVIPVNGFKAKVDTYTEYSDEDYYSETTYYLTKTAYKQHLKEEEGISNTNTKSLTKYETVNDDANDEFVIAASKKIFVLESADENGEVNESRPLKKAEIDQLVGIDASDNNDKEKSTIHAVSEIEPGTWDEPEVLIGKDTTSIYYLTIQLSVVRETDTNLYKVSGTAKWKNAIDEPDEQTVEATSLDYIGLTWGGNGALCANYQYTYGVYWYNSEEVAFSKKISDSYSGFVWQFKEMNLLNPMNYAVTIVKLRQVYPKVGKETNAKMTYIHTYNQISGSLSLSIGTNEAAAGVTFSASENYWQVEIDVPKITY